jgi:ATP-dependent Clp protease, proteolytic subunit ClpP
MVKLRINHIRLNCNGVHSVLHHIFTIFWVRFFSLILPKNQNTVQKKFFNIIPGDGEVAILLYGDVGDGQRVDSGRVVAELMALQSQYSKIDVRINSRGGDVFNGIAIYNALRTSKADITVYIDGVAASIAGIIALCGKPLYMSPYAKLMLHSVSGGAWGNASDLRSMAEQMEVLQGDLAAMIAGRCGMDKEEVLAKYFDEKDHWLNANEALEMKLIDGIYDMDGEAVNAGSTDEIYTYFNNRLQTQPQNKGNEMALLETLKTGIPSFANLADENAVLAHVRELENKAAKADALAQAVEGYKRKLQDVEDKEIAAVVDKAVAERRITAEQKDSFMALMKTDRENTEKLLASMKTQPSRRIVDVYREGSASPANLADKSWDELDKAGQLSELRNADLTAFKAKYKEKFGLDYKE